MNCPTPPPLDLFGLPMTCDPTLTFLLYVAPVGALVTWLITVSVILARRQARARRLKVRETAEAVAFWEEPIPERPPTKTAVALARRLARRVEVAPAALETTQEVPIPAPAIKDETDE